MKRIIILASLLVTLSACTTATQPQTNAPAQSTNVNTAATPQTAAAMVSEADIIAREKQAWDAIKNKDYDGFAGMLADDQVEVSRSGIDDKAGTAKGVTALAL